LQLTSALLQETGITSQAKKTHAQLTGLGLQKAKLLLQEVGVTFQLTKTFLQEFDFIYQ